MLALTAAGGGARAQSATPPEQAPAKAPARTGGGFRLEGQPAVEEPFGDAETFRRSIDRYQSLHDEMQELRDEFGGAVQEVLRRVLPGLDGTPRPKRCPEADIAIPFGRASAIGQAYLRLGREIARHHEAVRDLAALGETDALTPDYRWKVKQILANHKALLVDYKEMKAIFHEQLSAEVRAVGCDPEALIARSKTVLEREPEPKAPVVAAVDPKKDPKKVRPPSKPEPGPPRLAQSVAFHVDNQRCREPVRVYLDGTLVGELRAAHRGTFRSSAGPHQLCLLPGTSKLTCGAPGSVRKAYLHDGFTISMRCQ